MPVNPKALVSPDAPTLAVLRALEDGGAQIALVVDGGGCLLGTITDGDLRRFVLQTGSLDGTARDCMNPSPRTAPHDTPTAQIRRMLRESGTRQLPLLRENGELVDLVHVDRFRRASLPNAAFILAGGLGTRLGSITANMPKPLVPVGGRPILTRIIEHLSDFGITNVHLAVNHLAHMLEDHYGDGSDFGVDIHYVREEAFLGTAGAMSLLPEMPEVPMLVMNGDILTELDFDALLAAHAETGAAATMCVREYTVKVPYGVVDVDGDRFEALLEKPVHSHLVNSGIYCVNPEAIALLERNQRCDMPTLFERARDAGMPTHVFASNAYWMDIGQPQDLERARSHVDARKRAQSKK